MNFNVNYIIIVFLIFLQDYFKDAESWKTFFDEVTRSEKYEGELLINVQMDSLAKRLTALLKEIVCGKRLEYGEGVQRVSQWLENVKELMTQLIPCIHSNMKNYLEDLSVSISLLKLKENEYRKINVLSSFTL